MSKPIQEKSSGAAIFRMQDGKPVYLLLHYTAGHWDFPKGNMERGETEEETALREIKEETGIQDVELISNFRKTIRYYYKRGGTTIFKEVAFYLGKTSQEKIKISEEHLSFVWLRFKEAIKRLTFKGAKEVLKEADDFIHNLSKDPMSLDRFFAQNPKDWTR